MDQNWLYLIEQASDMSKIELSFIIYACCLNKTTKTTNELTNEQPSSHFFLTDPLSYLISDKISTTLSLQLGHLPRSILITKHNQLIRCGKPFSSKNRFNDKFNLLFFPHHLHTTLMDFRRLTKRYTHGLTRLITISARHIPLPLSLAPCNGSKAAVVSDF